MTIDLNLGYHQIYEALRKDPERELRRHQLLEGKVSIENFRPEFYSEGIGSFDATSCMGCIFTAKEGKHVVSFHYDGRSLDNLFPLFEAYKGEAVQLEIIGGIQSRDKRGEYGSDYHLVEEESTQMNFERLINFSRQLPCQVDLESWTIGSDSKVGLVSEYLAQPEGKVTLLETGSIYQKCLPPEFIPRYTVNSLMQENGMSIVFDSLLSPELNLGSIPHKISDLEHFARDVQSFENEKFILAEFSTTPELEPPYFCDTLRKVSEFVLSDDSRIKPRIPLPNKSPCIILQGEAARILS